MPWARHSKSADEDQRFHTSTEYVVVGETVAPGSELELVDAFGSIVERQRNEGGAPSSDVVRWMSSNPELEVQIDGRPLRERPWAQVSASMN